MPKTVSMTHAELYQLYLDAFACGQDAGESTANLRQAIQAARNQQARDAADYWFSKRKAPPVQDPPPTSPTPHESSLVSEDPLPDSGAMDSTDPDTLSQARLLGVARGFAGLGGDYGS